MSDDITQAIRTSLLPHKLSDGSLETGLCAIDGLVDARDHAANGFLTSPAYLRQAKAGTFGYSNQGYEFARPSVLIPAGLFALGQSQMFSNRNIKLPGIGHVFLLP